MTEGRERFQVLDGGLSAEPGFVCPWCGESFARRYIASDGVASLEEHWATDPRCKAHAHVNNQTQTKYGKADIPFTVPGEYTLFQARAKTCDHPEDMRQTLYASDENGELDRTTEIGWRCGYCYTLTPNEM